MTKVEIVKSWREVQNECIGPEKVRDGWQLYVFVVDKQIRRGKRGEYAYQYPKRLLTLSASTQEGLSDELARVVDAPNTILVTEKGEVIDVNNIEIA